MSRTYRIQLGFLLVATALVLAAGLGLRDPWPADEPRFALIARDMALNGNWLFPEVGGVVYPDKPPVFFWLVAGLFLATGSIKVALLLPGLLGGVGTVWLVADLARRLWDESAAVWSGAILLAMVQFPLQMKSGQIDGFHCFLTTLCLYGLCRHLLAGPAWGWYTAGGLAAGLGIITKGVGFLPMLILLPYAAAAYARWPVRVPGWRDRRWLAAPLAMLAVVAAWLIPMLVAVAGSNDPALAAYRDNILFHQTVTRYADSWGHIKPPWYLFTNAVPWLWLPVSFLLPWLVPAWRRDLRAKSGATLLLGAWVLLVLVFFSLSMGKRSVYIFPAAPAVALLAGQHAGALVARIGVRRMLVAIPLLLGAAFTGLAIYVLMNPHDVAAALGDIPAQVKASLVVLGTGLAVLGIVTGCRQRLAVTGYACSMLVAWLAYGLGVQPAVNGARSGSDAMALVGQALQRDETIAFAGWPEQFLLQWQRPVDHFGYRREPADERQDAAAWLALGDHRVVLLPDTDLGVCFDPQKVSLVAFAHRRNWVMARADSLTGACAPAAGQVPAVVHYRPPAAAFSRFARSGSSGTAAESIAGRPPLAE